MNKNSMLLLAVGLLAPGVIEPPRATVLVESRRTLSRADFAQGKAVVRSVELRRDGRPIIHVTEA